MYKRLAICLLLAFGCGQAGSCESSTSPEALGKAVVSARNAGDPDALHALRVTKDAYLEDLYPAFPSSRNNFSGDFAWGNLNKKCLVGVRKWVGRFGEKEYQFAGIRFDRPQEFYDGFSLLRGAVLTVSTPEGAQRDLRILGSVVVQDGTYSLLSYDD